MIGWVAAFLLLAWIAAVYRFGGIAGIATRIAWILFIVGLALAVLSALFLRRRSTT